MIGNAMIEKENQMNKDHASGNKDLKRSKSSDMMHNDDIPAVGKKLCTHKPSTLSSPQMKQTNLLSHFTKLSGASIASNNSNKSSQQAYKQENCLMVPNISQSSTGKNFSLKDQSNLDSTLNDTKSSSNSFKLDEPSLLPPPTFPSHLAELLHTEITQLPLCWLSLLADEIQKPYFIQLKEFLLVEENSTIPIYPPPLLRYNWARLCPFSKVRVVILGQDPYHGPGQAMGLCFSVPIGIPIPPSLQNMYKELAQDIEGFQKPSHGDLTHWAKQGVLLLNTSLSVREGQAASHAGKGWEIFTDAVIRSVSQRKDGVVFILWGNHAQTKIPMIDKKKHLILRGAHPSPLSANKGFFGCKHFSKTNEYLVEHGKTPIDWQIPTQQTPPSPKNPPSTNNF